MKKIEICISDESYEKLNKAKELLRGAFVESEGGWALEISFSNIGTELTFKLDGIEREIGEATVIWDDLT